MSENTNIRQALEKAFIAMTLARALPGVEAEYDFGPAIDAARAALAETKPRQESDEHKSLYQGTAGCDGEVLVASGGGVKCSKCRGWFCY